MTIFAELKRMHSPDVADLEKFSPNVGEDFNILVQAMFGPKDVEGEESFDIQLCTIGWIKSKLCSTGFVVGRNLLICTEFSFPETYNFLKDYAAGCSGENWQEVAIKLSMLGKWEFENYRA